MYHLKSIHLVFYNLKPDREQHLIQIYRCIWVLWEIEKDDWESVLRGLDKSRVKFVIASGLIVSPDQPWLAFNLFMISVSFVIMSFFVYVGGMSIYFARNDLVAFVEIAHAYTFVCAFWVLLFVHYMFKVPFAHELLQTIDGGIFEYKTKYGRDNDEKLINKMRFYHSLFQKLFHSAIATALAILCFLGPFIIKFFGNEDRKKIKEINYNFPVPLWFPFNTDTVLGFSLAYGILFFQISLIAVYLSAAIPFLVYVAFEINTQYIILKNSILNLEQRALERYNVACSVTETQIQLLREDPIFERCVQESLKENLLHHIEILRFFSLYQDLSSTIFGIIIGVSMVILASLSLVLTKIELFSFETVKFAFFFIVELVVVFGYCLMGTFLTDGSLEIPSALYNCPWYNLNENHRRMLRVFQINSSISIELRGNGLFLIDLQLFVQIVQTTYSIFNIFSSMET
ncbi:uncharacterized protein LOC120353354 [Nilaparvata lugens]|uniref:uncharacterized protein LOC120353354 n=1 Tax=Nilaparvata lugens TaxID=108931 RepID=UPI00193CCD4C|nr:uncharacterized protein LOC120353354 [Nilaparvata lugens]